MSKVRYIRAPKDLSPQLKGIYGRVARRLGVDSSYVSQVARGECHSALVEDALRRELTGIMEQRAKSPSRHEVQFYTNDKVLLDRLVPFVSSALKNGDAAVIVATEPHRDSLARRLKTEDLDFDAAIKAGRYVALDSIGTLSITMVQGMPESGRFFKVVGGLIEEAAKTGKPVHPRVAVFGEGVSHLCQEGKTGAAIRLEQLWNELEMTCEIDVLCGYEMSGTHEKMRYQDFKSICAEHSAVHGQGKWAKALQNT